MEAGVCLECSGHFFSSISSWNIEPSDSLTCLLLSNFVSSLSVLFEVYFTFSVSLIFLIRWLSKHLPSGLPSGQCLHSVVIQLIRILPWLSEEVNYIYFGFHFASILSLFSLSCLFGCLHLFYSCWRPSSNTRDLPQTMPFILRADSETLTGKRWASLQIKVWSPETSFKDYTHLYVSSCGIFTSSKQESFSD